MYEARREWTKEAGCLFCALLPTLKAALGGGGGGGGGVLFLLPEFPRAVS